MVKAGEALPSACVLIYAGPFTKQENFLPAL